MIPRGQFPYKDAVLNQRHNARVADGFIILTVDGDVQYASPNGISCFRRLGMLDTMEGGNLGEIGTGLIHENDPVSESLPIVLLGKAAMDTEMDTNRSAVSMRSLGNLGEIGTGLIHENDPVSESLPIVLLGKAAMDTEMDTNRSAVSMRSLPLMDAQGPTGAIVLCRDVTELRRREVELQTKDATISEIHHRVKNNLQAVSALLRLQARKTKSDEVKKASCAAQPRWPPRWTPTGRRSRCARYRSGPPRGAPGRGCCAGT